jgi:hypothetical protein
MWWALSAGIGNPGNQINSIHPLNPFDLFDALWTFCRWRLPAEWRLRRARRYCARHGHLAMPIKFRTRVGVYESRECVRCGHVDGWYRPDGSRVDRDWCAEGHVLNYIIRTDSNGVGRCVTCGEVVS